MMLAIGHKKSRKIHENKHWVAIFWPKQHRSTMSHLSNTPVSTQGYIFRLLSDTGSHIVLV